MELRGSRVPSWTRCLVSTLQNQGMLPVAGFQVTLFSAPAPVPHFLHILCGMQSLEGTQTIRLCIAGSWSRGDCVGYALLTGPFHGCFVPSFPGLGWSFSTPEGCDYMDCWGHLSEYTNQRAYMSGMFLWVQGLNPRVSECTRKNRLSVVSGMTYIYQAMPEQDGSYITSQRVPVSWVWCS